MKYKLLVVDIDGTLIKRDWSISAENRKALAAARQSGVAVALSTGRAAEACRSIIDQLALDGYHIFFDGALVASLEEEVYAKPLDGGVVGEAIEFVHRHNIGLELYSLTHYFVERENWATEIHRRYFGIEPTVVDFASLGRERIIKGGLITRSAEERAKAESFRRYFDQRLHFSVAGLPAFPEIVFFNILAPHVSKGEALEVLVSRLGVSLDEVMAVGDGSNDVALLSRAGLAVAMGNAPAEVKAIADHTTLDVDQNGLAAAIERFLPG